MKNLINSAIFLIIISGFSSCEYDNYEEPDSIITGRFIYNSEEIGVRNNLDVLRLYEEGWQNFTPIDIPVKHTGKFETVQSNGNYKLYVIPGNGPWKNISDTLDFELRGQKNLDIEVEPFFWLSNVQINASSNEIIASANLEQIDTTRNLQYVSLFIGKTMLVDNQFNLKEERVPAGQVADVNGPISINMNLDGVEETTVFARVGVKATGNPQLLFSQVQKLEL